MVIEWREREHEDIDSQVIEDLKAMESIQRCGLRNFFETSNIRAQKRLLQVLIIYWDPNADAFMLDGQPLKLEVEDMYFIIGLSRLGDIVNLRT
jgi:hypothetical protein